MKILIVGNLGSMGTRYQAICKHLGHEVIGMDLGHKTPIPPVDRAIIATPTDTHKALCIATALTGIPFLCEKPVSKNPEEIEAIIGVCEKNKISTHMVCNWRFAGGEKIFNANEELVEYDYYNTGKDGFSWDMIQLIYLSKGIPKIKNKSPIFKAKISGVDIGLDTINNSYIAMIQAWIHFPEFMWTMEDAYYATKKVIEYEKNI